MKHYEIKIYKNEFYEGMNSLQDNATKYKNNESSYHMTIQYYS